MNQRAGHFKQAIHGIRWIAASRLITQASTWLLTILSVRLLQPTDYGLVSMAGLVTVLVAMVLEGGATIALVHKPPASRHAYASVSQLLFLLSCGAAILIGLCAPLVAQAFNQPLLTNVLRVAVLQFPLSALCVVPNAMLQTELRFRQMAITQASIGITQGVITVLMAWLGFGYWSLIVATLAGLVGRLGLLCWYVRPPFSLGLSLGEAAPYWRSSKHLIPQKITWFCIQEMDTFLIARLLGAAPVGLYATAKTLSHTLMDRMSEIVNQVSLPSFAAKQNDREGWLNGFARLQSFSASISFPIFWGLAAVGPTLLPIILGPKWNAVVWPFGLFCFVMPFRVAYALTDTVVVGSGHAALSFGNVLIWAVILAPMLLLGSSWGVVGVAAAWAIGFPLIFLITTRRISRAIGVRWSEMLRPMLVPGGVSATMWVTVQVLALGIGPFVLKLVLIPTQIVLGAVVYLVGMRVFSRDRFSELANLASQLAGFK